MIEQLLALLESVDRSKARDLEVWKPAIAEYCYHHYGDREWRLDPKCIVLHYTAGKSFPQNLVDTQDFAGEKPGLASHYVVGGQHVWEILPPTVRSRATFGVNHRAISIEMVGADAQDLMENRQQTLDRAASLVVDLRNKYSIPASETYSHQQVATMDRSLVPWVMDLLKPGPYDKIDPGEGPMRYILQRCNQSATDDP